MVGVCVRVLKILFHFYLNTVSASVPQLVYQRCVVFSLCNGAYKMPFAVNLKVMAVSSE